MYAHFIVECSRAEVGIYNNNCISHTYTLMEKNELKYTIKHDNLNDTATQIFSDRKLKKVSSLQYLYIFIVYEVSTYLKKQK